MDEQKIYYSVKNLRSIEKMDSIELKKINILIGKNSVGKSTFLRSLWLLRRSVTQKAGAPILWYGGPGDQIDFGDFETSIFKNSVDQKISFKFGLSSIVIDNLSTSSMRSINYLAGLAELKVSDVALTVGVGSSNGKTVKRKVDLDFRLMGADFSFSMVYGADGRISEIYLEQESILQSFIDEAEISDLSNGLFPDVFCKFINNQDEGFVWGDIGYALILGAVDVLTENADKRISYFHGEMRKILIQYKNNFLNKIGVANLIRSARSKSLKKLYESFLDENNQNLNKIKNFCALYVCFIVMVSVSAHLTNIFSSSAYIGPTRANAERYYRVQELQVSEIEADGRNLANWLNSLNRKRLDDFSSFFNSLFGYHIKAEVNKGNISLLLKKDSSWINLVDTGFGFSQMLPVVAQLWLSANPEKVSSPKFLTSRPVLVEQPELHLHPAYQSKLSEVFSHIARSNSQDIRLLIETHSEAIINRLGSLVANGDISPSDIQILVFNEIESNVSDRASSITVAGYNKDGILFDWPYGFFNSEQ